MLTHDRPFQQPGIGRGRRAITGADTVIASDQGNTIDITSGTFSLAFTAAATLGNKFHVAIYNSGSGVVTLDPAGTETIRTVAGTVTTLALVQGQGVTLSCDGSNWDVIADSGVSLSNAVDSVFRIVGSADATKKLAFEVDAETTAVTTTINTGAQTASFSATLPVMPSSSIFAISAAALTTGRVPVATTNGLLTDFSALTASASQISIAANGTAAAPAMRIGASEVHGLYRISASAVGLSINGAAGLQLGSSSTLAQIASAGSYAYGTSVTDGAAIFMAGSSTSASGQIRSYGSTHATKADYLEFNRGSTVAMFLDGSGILTLNTTTEATAVGTASAVLLGGLGVAKRSFLGTIGTSFKGNVNAGVQDGTAPTTGAVGESLTSVVSAVAVAATTTVGNITSISVTRGLWSVRAFGVFKGGATGFTLSSALKLSIVSTSATNGTSGSTMTQQSVLVLLANGIFALDLEIAPINISATTTYYLTAETTYAAGSPTVDATLLFTRIG